MTNVRVRMTMLATIGAAAAAAIVAWAMVTPLAAPAADVSPQLPSQTLLLDERLTPNGPQGGVAGGTPRSLVALRGEREGFQFAVQNSTGSELNLVSNVVATDNALGPAMSAGTITFELLRVGFVDVPRASTGLGTKAGTYPDPLPQQRPDSGAAGMLSIPAGQWGGFAIIAKVRTDAAPGTYSANAEIVDRGGNVYARQPFTLDVRNLTLVQSGEKGSFSTVLNVEGDAYWLQDDAMRTSRPSQGLTSDRMIQLSGLMNFVDERGITPLEPPFGVPSRTGAYTCSWTSRGVAPMSFLTQLTTRYFTGGRDIDPSRTKFPVRFAPAKTVGCEPDGQSQKFEATLPGPSGAKQDDLFNPAASKFFSKVRSQWSSSNLWGSRTYVKHPFDEPSATTPAYRKTMDVEVPKATVALRRAFGSNAKIVIADWPRDSTSKRICRPYKGGQRCSTLSGDDHSNKKGWDGKGSDDPDVWMVPFSRLYGRTTTPLLKPYGKAADRTAEYVQRLDRIKKLRGGREIWAYNFYTADARVPQLSIDAPSTDARLQYWMLARDGHTGLYVSNFMLGWGQGGSGTKKWPDGLVRKGNPYESTPYFEHANYGAAAGWGTFVYPGYSEKLGLVGESTRNSERSVPVTSLRLEGMRDGQEDANLMAMYRARFGDAKLKALLKPVFPGTLVPLTGSKLGNVTTLKYSNAGIAARMDAARSEMIAALTA